MDFKTAADDVRARGAAARGEYDPAPDSWTARTYNKHYARDYTGERPVRENFCHYWRIVLIWSWLTPLLYGVLVAAETVGRFLLKVTGPVGRAVKRAAIAVSKNSTVRKVTPYVMGTIVALLLLAAVAGLVYSLIHDYGWGAAWAIPVILGLATAVFLLHLRINYLAEKARKAEDKKQQVKDERYRVYCDARDAYYDALFRGDVSEGALAILRESMDLAYEMWLYGRDTRKGVIKERKPRKTPVRDFFRLVWNVILVNKWKICPFVNVPETK